jgi:hypothetical protein
VRVAAEGGVSRLVTADDLVARMRRRYPHHLARLTEPYLFNRADYAASGTAPFVAAPVFDLTDPGAPTVLYNRSSPAPAATPEQPGGCRVTDTELAAAAGSPAPRPGRWPAAAGCGPATWSGKVRFR